MQRLRVFFDATGLAAFRLAAILGMSQPRMSALVLEKRMPTREEARRLDAVYRVLSEVLGREGLPTQGPAGSEPEVSRANPVETEYPIASRGDSLPPFPKEWEMLEQALSEARYQVQLLERKVAENNRRQQQARVCLAWLQAWAREPMHPVVSWSENYRSSAEDQCRFQLRPRFAEPGYAINLEVETLRLRRLEQQKAAWGSAENPG